MTTLTGLRPLKDMQDEVVAWCESKGWREDPIPFDDAMALLHTEVAEASDAWRVWGLGDGTAGSAVNPGGDPGAKPEGVGSEFADVLIRLLDDSDQFSVDLTAAAMAFGGSFGINDSFLTNMNTLHTMVARASMAAEFSWDEDHPETAVAREFAGILTFLLQLSEHYGVDLQAEYTRKMRYNETRPWKHGGKRR